MRGNAAPRRAAVIAVALATILGLAAGCVEARTTMCGPLICPVGKVCDDFRVTCVPPEQVAACGGLDELAPCDFPAVGAGACDHGVCYPTACGNDRVELGEICDDGNQVGDDGCSADCQSNEACGNLFVDVVAGEECDDGGDRSHDGCSSQCLVEVAVWTERTSTAPVGLQRHRAVYDASRDRVVVLGGTTPTGDPVPTTFEWAGARWQQIRTVTTPPERAGHAAAYDAGRRRVVLFGGEGRGGALHGDTWEYDGGDWQRLLPPGEPAPRTDTAAVYDAARGRVVLFGGEGSGGARLADTWDFDGARWTNRSGGAAPPARAGHVMAYDAARQRVVLFGGATAAAALVDTWEWDGDGWVETTPATTPTARGVMAYDAARARIVLFGGDGSTALDDTWAYDGDDWVELEGASPPARVGAAMAFDAGRGAVVMTGGGNGIMGFGYQDTWILDGAGWHDVPPVLDPPERIYAGLAHDDWRGGLVLFGGRTPPSTPRTDTWRFVDQQWIEQGVDRAPPPGADPTQMVFDPVRGRTIIVRDGGPTGMETWGFDGVAWDRVATVGAPPSRSMAALAYDRRRDRVVLFGGEAGGAVRADTWELAGDTWTETTPATSPPVRRDARMTYDERGARVVLFGGAAGAAQSAPSLGDTWAYDGTAWTRLDTGAAPDAAPAARPGVGLAYSAVRERVVLFGGDGVRPWADTWELDDATWTRVATAASPMPRKTPNLVYDRGRHVIVLHGGDPRHDTWELTYVSATPDEACGGGGDDDGDDLIDCADPDCAEASCSARGEVCRAAACTCSGPAAEVTCGDRRDDDCDGLIDCADPDCATSARCTAELACADDLDDDGDGLIDCADPGCVGTDGCEVREVRCADGADDDGDDQVDCADLDCFLAPCPARTTT